MFAYTVRRLLQMIPLLLAASVVIYALLALQPGDPLEELKRQNPRMTAEQFEALKRAYGLDQPLHIRYFKWLSRAVRGDLGYSRTYGIPTAEYIFVQRLPKTLILSGLALTLALVVAIPVGVFSAVRQYSLADYVITFLSFVGFSMPVFFLGILLLYLFAIWLPDHIPGFPRFPTGGGARGALGGCALGGDKLLVLPRAMGLAPHPSGHRPFLLADGGVDPLHAGFLAGGAFPGLHSHRPGQGLGRAGGALQARP